MRRIRNFVELTTDIGTTGQPALEQFANIARNGYEVVINLAMPDQQDSIESEGSVVTSLCMSHVHIPVRFDSTKPNRVRQCCELMDTLQGSKIFVHCSMNDRVSVFLFHYVSKVRGLSEDESRSPIFHSWTPEEQRERLISLSKRELGLYPLSSMGRLVASYAPKRGRIK